MRLIVLLAFILCESAKAQTFSAHFAEYLKENYPAADFSGTSAGVNSSYGGRASAGDPIYRRPVVLVHGSTDRAVGGHSGGWSSTIEALLNNGYRTSEVYALTWGDGQQNSGVRNAHQNEYIDSVHDFIEAVLNYTGFSQVDVIAHSMGVTLTRGAVKGIGSNDVSNGNLLGKIRTFIAIAGANKGVGACLNPFSDLMPTCSKVNGFHPESRYLSELNTSDSRVADSVYTLWSRADDVLGRPIVGRRNPVPPEITSQLDDQTQTFGFDQMTHLQVRDLTTDLQLQLLIGN